VKLKYYLRGLGIGIFLTSIIFMIGMYVNRKDLFSDEEIMVRARELGMVMEDAEPKTLDELEKEQKENQEKKKAQDSSKSQETKKAKENNSESPQTVKQVEFDVLPGEYSDTISKKLFDAGLITNESEFNQFITDSDYDNFIQPGTFTIPEGSTYEDIAKILTTKQENR
jgi:hypothetical protein